MKKSAKNSKTMKRLLSYAKPYTGGFLLAITLIFGIVFLELYQPILLGKATDLIVNSFSAPNNNASSDIITLGCKYLGIVISAVILTYIQSLILSYIGQKIIFNIRKDVFEHIHTLSINFFHKTPIGVLVTRATNDIEALNELYTSVIVNIIKSLCMIIGLIATMLMFNVKLSLISFTVMPVIIIATSIFGVVSKKSYRQLRSKIAELNAFVSEHVSGMKIVQIFAVENKVFRYFKTKTESLRKQHFKQVSILACYTPVSYVTNMITLVMLIWFGTDMVLAGEITIGTIVIFQRYLSKIFEPIEEFNEQFNAIQSASAAAEKIFTLLDEEADIVNSENSIELTNTKGEIEFKNVWFAYKDEEWILKDISFKVKHGQKVAFVGNTGAGKTTIQNLIARYYDIQKGEILIDGINIKNIEISSLRKNIGQMLQDVFLFTGDVKSNIRLRDNSITENELIEAAKYVNADPFISKLKDGYNEHVLERGSSFSTGQRQLLSFARTLAFKPNILILDEATANIDTETELLIQDALAKLMQGRTTLVVAHRLSTIQNADKIIVLHKGKIVEQGTHQQLLANKDMYYKLYKLQYE